MFDDSPSYFSSSLTLLNNQNEWCLRVSVVMTNEGKRDWSPTFRVHTNVFLLGVLFFLFFFFFEARQIISYLDFQVEKSNQTKANVNFGLFFFFSFFVPNFLGV